jgi:hypothetical protein
MFAAGIGLDIAGAYLLARGVRGSALEIVKTTTAYWGWSVPERVKYARDQVDGSYGLYALVGGFGVQLLAYAVMVSTDVDTGHSLGRGAVAVAAGGLAAGLVLGVWKVTRLRLFRRFLLEIAHIESQDQEFVRLDRPDGAMLVAFGDAIEAPQLDGETDEAYALRAWGVTRITPTQSDDSSSA